MGALNGEFAFATYRWHTLPQELYYANGVPPLIEHPIFSPNTEILQGLGVPTGPMPDGSPNKMIFYQIATQKGMSIEDAQSGVIDIGISALTGLPIGKAR